MIVSLSLKSKNANHRLQTDPSNNAGPVRRNVESVEKGKRPSEISRLMV
jgi:hypothetical protein